MKKMMALALALVLALGLAACGTPQTASSAAPAASKAPAASSGGTSAAPAAGGKAACILGVGGLGDQSYNDLVYAGMQRAEKELGIAFDYSEPKQISEFELIMREMATSGDYGVIVCVGFDQIDPLVKVAPEFPDQKFAIIDGVVEGENIASYTCKEEEGSFLVGALAGLMLQNAADYSLENASKLGFVGAMEIPLIVKFNAGYQAGAKYVNPEAEVLVDYIAGDNAFSDTTTAKEIATSQFNKGAGIVYHAAGGSGLGVFQAAGENNFFAIGCNSNQNHIDPDHIVASMLKRVDTAAFEIVKAAVVDENLATNTEVVLGVADEGVGYTLENSNIKVSEEIVATIEELRAKIEAGELVIPATVEEVDPFLANNSFGK